MRNTLTLVRCHLRSLIEFYFVSRRIEIESDFGLRESAERLLLLNQQGEVRANITKQHTRVQVVCAHQGSRANVLPVFWGNFEARSGNKTILQGRIGIDPGVRFVFGIICSVALVFLPVTALFGIGKASFPGFEWVVAITMGGLLELAYLNGRGDADRILANLKRALKRTE